jgi:hypothetical protein
VRWWCWCDGNGLMVLVRWWWFDDGAGAVAVMMVI